MLLFFHGRECEHCLAMAPLVAKLEREHGVTVERKETWHDDANATLLTSTYNVDGTRCGGVPFFYNTDTDEWRCGEIDYDDLAAWAGVGHGR